MKTTDVPRSLLYKKWKRSKGTYTHGEDIVVPHAGTLRTEIRDDP